MQVMIDIPKKTFDEIRDRNITHCGEPFAQKLVSYIRNGTPQTKTGHWKIENSKHSNLARCSECNFFKDVDGWNFCPNCGAKMEESEVSDANSN